MTVIYWCSVWNTGVIRPIFSAAVNNNVQAVAQLLSRSFLRGNTSLVDLLCFAMWLNHSFEKFEKETLHDTNGLLN